MRDIFTRGGTAALIAGLALAVSACGGGEEAGDDAANNMLEGNLLLEEPGNDASAMESLTNDVEPAPETNAAEDEANASDDVLGETSGGDTGGDPVESNVSGM